MVSVSSDLRPVTDHFDLVGIDPRCTGKSGAVDCNTNWDEDAAVHLSPEDGLADDVDGLRAGARR